ncbi:uncharacterized protein FFB14_01315 [Fusarium fujikuroi]|nr:uncharacterized protein FFB14_01315 [Fusarium fujikuroi]
MHFKKIN